MKVLFLAPSAYRLGGVQEWLAALVPDLRRFGHSVRVAVPDGSRHHFERYQAAFPQLHCLPLVNPTGSAEGRRRCLERCLIREKADLVLGVNLGDLYPCIRRLRRRLGWSTPVAMTLHALELDYFSDLLMEHDVINAVIATNQLSVQLVRSLTPMAKDRVFYAPCGVAEAANAGRHSQDQERLTIGWIGRLEQEQKRIHDLTDILRGLDARAVAYQMLVVGDGPERETLAKDLSDWIQRGTVELRGSMTRQQVLETIYPRLDALLITSSWETGPIVAWEAMASGVPVVTSQFLGSQLEGALHDDRTCLMFPIGDGAAAAAQLAQLQRPERRQRLAEAGRSLVRQRYSQVASSRAWNAAMEAILQLPSLPRPTAADPPPSCGRLDRWLGTGPAETMRGWLGRRFMHSEPGDEWPHAVHGQHLPVGTLLNQARLLETHA